MRPLREIWNQYIFGRRSDKREHLAEIAPISISCPVCGEDTERVSPRTVRGVEIFWFMCKIHGARDYTRHFVQT